MITAILSSASLTLPKAAPESATRAGRICFPWLLSAYWTYLVISGLNSFTCCARLSATLLRNGLTGSAISFQVGLSWVFGVSAEVFHSVTNIGNQCTNPLRPSQTLFSRLNTCCPVQKDLK